MKKCPECGNPSYDGAPVCGNCGYKFPKPKVVAPKEDTIFQKEPKEKKEESDESALEIIKSKKLIIGAIVLITLIAICGIVLTGSNNSNTPSIVNTNDFTKYSEGTFSFTHPSSWQEVNGSDEDHEGAKFFMNDNNTLIEYYNVTSDATSLKEINQQRISYAQERGDYIETVETITLDGRNASNIILENADGNYTRYVSMFSDGELYVFKMSGDSVNSLCSEDIESTINSADIA